MNLNTFYSLILTTALLLNINNISAATINQSKNIYNQQLESCSTSPLTGFYRNGYCQTGINDHGTHVVCAQVTSEFLEFTKNRGNDLSTPRNSFPGLNNQDFWCLCALRWKEAHDYYKNNSTNTNVSTKIIPKIKLGATNIKMLDYINLDTLENNSI